jgi:hypothetical protein
LATSEAQHVHRFAIAPAYGLVPGLTHDKQTSAARRTGHGHDERDQQDHGLPRSEGSPGTGNRGHFWSSAWFTWTILSVGLIACGIYLWVTKIEPVIPGLLEFITQPL